MFIETKRQKGFTIVELLIVIIVIAILAALAITAYSGVQAKARDTKRRSDLEQLVKGMQLWAAQNDKLPTETGAGYYGGGSGWVNNGQPPEAAYPASIAGVLQDAGFLAQGVQDPTTPQGSGSYMFYYCPDLKKYGFFAKLESPSSGDSDDFNTWKNNSNCPPSPVATGYGMNYAKLFTASS